MLEAMKMELPIKAPRDGRVTAISCRTGELVQPGVPLLELESSRFGPQRRRAQRVQIVEVGPRDGLQNEPATIAVAEKVAFVNRLAAAGHSMIEVGGVRQPACGCRRWPARPTCLRPSPDGPACATPRSCRISRGSSARRRANVEEVAIFPAASETFSRRNLNHGIEEVLAAARAVCDAARAAGQRVRGYLSTCFGCPFEGQVSSETVSELTSASWTWASTRSR